VTDDIDQAIAAARAALGDLQPAPRPVAHPTPQPPDRAALLAKRPPEHWLQQDDSAWRGRGDPWGPI
jgi:hypothetical protein